MQEAVAAPTLRQQAEAAAELERRRCFEADSPEHFIEQYVWIEDKTAPSKVSRFTLWPAQLAALAEFLIERFLIALKARQLGFTWLVLAYAVWRMLKHPGFTVIAISKTDDDAIELVDIRLAKILLPRLPRWMIRPKIGVPDWWGGPVWSATKHEVTIHHPPDQRTGEQRPASRFKADAGQDAGRSITADLVLLDEWAANQWAPAIWEAAYPTVNRPGDGPESGQVFIISTNRRATLFEQQVIAARKLLSGFKLVFWSWSADPRRDLAWHENTKRALPQSHRQEYPSSIDDALSAGEATAFPEFDSREGGIHVCRPFPIPQWWRRWRSNDPGYTDPFAWHWFATDESGENVYIYREFTRVPSDPKLAYSEQAKRVKELSEPVAIGSLPEPIDFTVTGMDAFNQHPETGKAHVDYYQDGGLKGFIEPVHGPGARAAMKATWHEYLMVFAGPDGKPTARLHIFSTCTNLIETLPLLVTDENHPEQVAEMAIDHCYQSAGYGLQARHAIRSKAPAKPQTEAERLAAMKQKLAKKMAAPRRWA